MNVPPHARKTDTAVDGRGHRTSNAEVHRGDSRLVTARGAPSFSEAASSRRSGTPLLGFSLSPRAVMVLVPLLALSVGVAMAVVGQTALGASGRAMAKARCLERAESAERRIEDALGISDPVLDRLLRIGASELALPTDPDLERLARAALGMTELLTARTGISQAYVALPDGRFFSATPASAGPGRFHLTDGGITRHFSVTNEQLTEVSREVSGFDPRSRKWYQLAETTKKRSFTGPYSFYFDERLGVTRVDVVQSADRSRVLAVVGVDFDVATLTRFMAERDSADAHSVVFTSTGEVLVYPHGALGAHVRSEVRSHEELDDPLLDGLFAYLREHPRPERNAPHYTSELFRFEGGDRAYLATVRRLGEPAPDWFIATLSPEDSVLASLYAYRKTSLYVGALALVVAARVGRALGRQILRTRSEAERAKSELALARKEAHELGSYRLVSRLGEGGMGEVWRAEHRLLARRAAIKLIRSDRPMSDERREILEERFRREARAIAALRCRNTVELFDYGLTEDGTLYFVMELLDGIDLETLVHDHGPQPPERVRQILIQVCNSLSEAHDAGLVHRDVKPANVMLCRAADELDVVKVLDFGLVLSALDQDTPREPPAPKDDEPVESELLTGTDAVPETTRSDVPGSPPDELRLTRADMQLGTPSYMSPEQVLGSPLDGRADLYALGCVAFRLLTGRMPFEADTALGVMLEQIQSPVPNVAAHAAGVSSAFAGLVTSCLAKAPSERPSSARKLREALRALPPEAGWSDELASKWWQAHLPERPTSVMVSLPPGPRVDLVAPTEDYRHSPS